MAPARPRRALRERGRCARAAPAAPRRGLPARSGPLCPSVHVLFFCVSALTYFSFFFPYPPLCCIPFFAKADLRRCKWEKGLSHSRTLPCLVVAVAAARRRASSLPLRSASSQGCERAARLRPPAGDPSPPARRMPSRPVARLARRPAPPLPASVLPVEGERPGERGSPASSPGGLAEDGDSPARPGHTCSHLCPPVLQGQIAAQLVLLWVSSKLICLYCVEGLEGSRFGGTI